MKHSHQKHVGHVATYSALRHATAIRFVPKLVRLTKSHAAAAFLSQLLYWGLPNEQGVSRLRIRRQGKEWLAKSVDEWWDECSLSRQNLRTIEESLERLSVIEVQVWKFNGVPTKHYHLNLPVLLGYFNQIDLVDSTSSMEVVESTTSITETTTKNTSNDYKGLTEAAASEKKKKGGASTKNMAGKGLGKQESLIASGTSKNILPKLAVTKKALHAQPKRVSAKTLSSHWLQQFSLLYESAKGFTKVHTVKELGVLNTYLKTTGKHAAPAMDWALRNWQKIRSSASSAMAVNLPTEPTVYALLKVCQIAVNGYLKDAEPYIPEVVILPLYPTAPKNTDPLATTEEIVAMLDSLKNP